MFCNNCGQPILEGSKFCTGCGETVGEPTSDQLATSGPSPTPEPQRPPQLAMGPTWVLLNRMIGAARLNIRTYEEVGTNKNATIQAILVVAIVGGALKIGGGGFNASGFGPFAEFVIGIIGWLVLWAIWALIVRKIGTTILRDEQTNVDVSWGQLARVTAFAQTPMVLGIFAIIPVINWMVGMATFSWCVAAEVVAIRQALSFESTWRAVGVVVLASVLMLAVPIIAILLVYIFYP